MSNPPSARPDKKWAQPNPNAGYYWTGEQWDWREDVDTRAFDFTRTQPQGVNSGSSQHATPPIIPLIDLPRIPHLPHQEGPVEGWYMNWGNMARIDPSVPKLKNYLNRQTTGSHSSLVTSHLSRGQRHTSHSPRQSPKATLPCGSTKKRVVLSTPTGYYGYEAAWTRTRRPLRSTWMKLWNT
jgi:hypothetical protein